MNCADPFKKDWNTGPRTPIFGGDANGVASISPVFGPENHARPG